MKTLRSFEKSITVYQSKHNTGIQISAIRPPEPQTLKSTSMAVPNYVEKFVSLRKLMGTNRLSLERDRRSVTDRG